MPVVALRDYQANAIDELRGALRTHRRALLQSPTGSGKSVIIAHMMRESARRGLSSWLVCHRRELLDQLSDQLWDLDVQHGMIAGGKSGTKDAVQVASVQTLVRRLHKLPPPDLLAVDEAHHATAKTYRKIIDHCSRAWTIGLTATPQRTDGTGLGDIFDTLVRGPDVATLTRRGFLAPYRIIAPPHPMDTTGVHSKGGDYVKSELEVVVDQSTVTGNAVQHYKKYVHPRTCLVYCVTRAHARHVTEAYQRAGIFAVYVAGDTPAAERRVAIEGFRKGMPPVIVSVDLFGEGLDAPGLVAVQLLRPTRSLILHLQQIGRALRVEEGKDEAIILDHAGNTWLHGLPDDEREWTLEGREKKNGKPQLAAPSLRHCPNCFSIFKAQLGKCPACGYTPQVKERVPEETDEELVEIQKAQHRKMRRMEEGRARDLESLVRLAQSRGYKVSWAGIRYWLRNKKRISRADAIRKAYSVAEGLDS